MQSILSEFSEDEILAGQSHQDAKERFELKSIHPKLKKHSKLEDYRKYLKGPLYRRLFKFSSIRNPWERLVSLYFTPGAGRNEWSRGEFLKLIERTPPVERYVSLPPSFWARTFGGKVKPLDHDLNYLIRFENLESDFHSVCEQIGLPPLPVPVFNQSKRAHYSGYYDEELVARVAEKFAREIEWGNYRFEESETDTHSNT